MVPVDVLSQPQAAVAEVSAVVGHGPPQPSLSDLHRRYRIAVGRIDAVEPGLAVEALDTFSADGLSGAALRRFEANAEAVVERLEARATKLEEAARRRHAFEFAHGPITSYRPAIARRLGAVQTRFRGLRDRQRWSGDPATIAESQRPVPTVYLGADGLRWSQAWAFELAALRTVQRLERQVSELEARHRNEERARIAAMLRNPPPDEEWIDPTFGLPWNDATWRTEMVWRLHALAARTRALVAAWRDTDPALARKAAALLEELRLVWICEGLALEQADDANAGRLEDWERRVIRMEARPIPPPLPPGLAWRQAFDGTWQLENTSPAPVPPPAPCCDAGHDRHRRGSRRP